MDKVATVWRVASVWALVVVVVGLAVLDAVLIHREGPEASLSATLTEAARRWPIVPFVFGVVVGHLFWPAK